MIRKQFILPNSLVMLMVLGSTSVARSDDIPAWGAPIPELSEIDDEAIDIMTENDLTGLAVGVMKEGCVVYQRAFGWRDGGTIAMPENATMRLASVSKPLTKRAILLLEAGGALSQNDKVFDVGQAGGGILDLDPFLEGGAELDDRVGDITVKHLLDHKAGWAADYSWWEIAIANAMDVNSPPGLVDTIRYAIGQELATDPGVNNNYSNFGYNVLVAVIEEVSGLSFTSYLRQHVLTKAMWVPSTNLFGAQPFSKTGLREPDYIAEPGWDAVTNVFDPDGPSVTWPYGGFDANATHGSSTLAASVAPMLTFIHEYYPNGGFGFIGSMPGSNSIVRARSDDIGIVVLLNERIGAGAPYHAAEELADRIDVIIDGGVAWPTQCIDGQWVDDSGLLGIGSYDTPFHTLTWALGNITSGTKLLFHPGDYNWTGVLSSKLRLDAPFGSAIIGN